MHGGGNMMFHLIRILSRRHRLTVLAFYEKNEEREQIPRLAPFCEQLEVVYRGQTFDASNALGLKPPEIAHEFYHQRMWHLVEKHLKTQKFDLIQCEYLQTGHFANVDRKIPAVLTDVEVLSLSYASRYRALPWSSPRKFSALTAWMRMINYEEKLLRRFAAVVVLTEREQEFLARYAPGVKVYQNPMGVDSDFFSPGPQPPEKASVVFVGNFRHPPNLSGAMWFLRQVWPRIRARNPEARLYIVGGSPTPALQGMDGLEGVTVTGFVEDVRPYLQRAAVFIAPIFEGAGLRTKVLEAWAMQKPVVGTRLAFAGLTGQDGEVCRMAEDPATFADSVCELLENTGLANQMGVRARQLVLSRFSWEAFADLYDRIYQELLVSAESLATRAALAGGLGGIPENGT
jgi:glycosyltransferase involved in cell wall biosynthesis